MALLDDWAPPVDPPASLKHGLTVWITAHGDFLGDTQRVVVIEREWLDALKVIRWLAHERYEPDIKRLVVGSERRSNHSNNRTKV